MRDLWCLLVQEPSEHNVQSLVGSSDSWGSLQLDKTYTDMDIHIHTSIYIDMSETHASNMDFITLDSKNFNIALYLPSPWLLWHLDTSIMLTYTPPAHPVMAPSR